MDPTGKAHAETDEGLRTHSLSSHPSSPRGNRRITTELNNSGTGGKQLQGDHEQLPRDVMFSVLYFGEKKVAHRGSSDTQWSDRYYSITGRILTELKGRVSSQPSAALAGV